MIAAHQCRTSLHSCHHKCCLNLAVQVHMCFTYLPLLASLHHVFRIHQEQRRVQRSRHLHLSNDIEAARQACGEARRRLGTPEWCSRLLAPAAAVANDSNVAVIHDDDRGGGIGGRENANRAASPQQQGHRGFLFELFELKQQDSNAEKCFQGLASLLCECT